MKNLKFLTTLILLIAVLLSCSKNKEEGVIVKRQDCTFVQNDSNMDGLIDDEERNIMNECMENSLLSKAAIESNLIGEWELTGHGEGWLPTISQPCGYIVISEDELTFEFKNNHIDTILSYQWEIEEVDWSAEKYFRLSISENMEGLFINHFCENFIYGDATPSDGNMYLYRKVK